MLREIVQDRDVRNETRTESVEMLEAATEADLPAADTEADLEWRQFIHQELEKVQNREKVELNRMPKRLHRQIKPLLPS